MVDTSYDLIRPLAFLLQMGVAVFRALGQSGRRLALAFPFSHLVGAHSRLPWFVPSAGLMGILKACEADTHTLLSYVWGCFCA